MNDCRPLCEVSLGLRVTRRLMATGKVYPPMEVFITALPGKHNYRMIQTIRSIGCTDVPRKRRCGSLFDLHGNHRKNTNTHATYGRATS